MNTRKTWSEQDIPSMGGKRVLVTGAASGIGFEAARALAQHGAEVLVVDRNEEAGRAALLRILALQSGAKVQFLPLDLSDQQAVKDFAERLVAQGRPLDVLINNAGIQPISERRTSKDGFELTFGIGHLGHFTLTLKLLELLLAAPAPRVVTVSSMVHGKGHFDWSDLQMARNYSSQRAYNQTKLANLLFALELHSRINTRGRRLMSVAVHPGVAQTSIGANRKSLGQYHLGDHLVSAVLSLVMPLLGQPASAGALPTLYGASSAQAQSGRFYGPDGFGEMKGAPKLATIKGMGNDADAARHLWEVSEQLTGVVLSASIGKR